MNHNTLVALAALAIPIAAVGCNDEADRVLEPEPSSGPESPAPAPELPPTADAGPDVTFADLDEDGAESVTLDGCGCQAGSSPIVEYAWREEEVELVGTVGDDGCSLTLDLELGRHEIWLTVTDEAGRAVKDATIIVVRTPRPDVWIHAMGAGTTFATGSDVTLRATAVDWRGESIPGDRLVWESDLGGELGTGTTITRRNLARGDHKITVTATDGDGYSSVATIGLRIADGPTVIILSPADGSSCAVFDEMHLEGRCTDSDGWPVTGPGVYWEPDMWMGEHRRYQMDVDVVCTGPGPQHISLVCTDENGITARSEVTVHYVISYDFNIRAVLEDFGCTECHGAIRQEAGVRFDTHVELVTGGTRNGPLIVAGDADQGILISKLLASHHDPDGRILTTPFYWGWVNPAVGVEKWWVERFLAPWIEDGAPDN